MAFSFQKYVGAGNDFMFVGASELPTDRARSEWASRLCDRSFGVGADGLVVFSVTELKTSQFAWDFYNSDGSKAEMCGNAARCAALYCKDNYQALKSYLSTVIGTVEGQVLESGLTGSQVEVSWALKNGSLEQKEIQLKSGSVVKGFYVNTGVPHFVIKDTEFRLSKEICREIQDHEFFSPHKTNVTLLVESQSNSAHRTKTFERGVQDFTLACGTGVIASALVVHQTQPKTRHELLAPGGQLFVEVDGLNIKLIGPAKKVFTGQYNY